MIKDQPVNFLFNTKMIDNIKTLDLLLNTENKILFKKPVSVTQKSKNYLLVLEDINSQLEENNLSKTNVNQIVINLTDLIKIEEFRKTLKSNYYLVNLLLSYQLGMVKIGKNILEEFNFLSIDNIFTFYYFLRKILRIPAGNQKDKLNVLLEKIHPDKNLTSVLKCFNFALKEFRQKYLIQTKDYVIATKSYSNNFNEEEFFKTLTWDFDKDFKMMINKGLINNKVYYEPELTNNYYLNYLTILFLRANIKLELPEFDDDILLEIVLGKCFYGGNSLKSTVLFQKNNQIELLFEDLQNSIKNLSNVRGTYQKFSFDNFEFDKSTNFFYFKNFKNQIVDFPPELLFKIIPDNQEKTFNYFIVNEV